MLHIEVKDRIGSLATRCPSGCGAMQCHARLDTLCMQLQKSWLLHKELGRGSKSQSLHVLASDKDDACFKEAEVGTARNLKGGMRCCFEGLFERAPRDVGPSLPRVACTCGMCYDTWAVHRMAVLVKGLRISQSEL